MRAIDPKKITDNFIEMIGHEWMLVTAGSPERFNTMTASWGTIGYLWNRPVATVFVRPERYTYEFMESGREFTLAFLGLENKAAHKVAGTQSGRDIDKMKETGLHPLPTERGNVIYEEARIALECRTLYTDAVQQAHFLEPGLYEQWYGGAHGGDHKIYVAEIVSAWER